MNAVDPKQGGPGNTWDAVLACGHVQVATESEKHYMPDYRVCEVCTVIVKVRLWRTPSRYV